MCVSRRRRRRHPPRRAQPRLAACSWYARIPTAQRTAVPNVPVTRRLRRACSSPCEAAGVKRPVAKVRSSAQRGANAACVRAAVCICMADRVCRRELPASCPRPALSPAALPSPCALRCCVGRAAWVRSVCNPSCLSFFLEVVVMSIGTPRAAMPHHALLWPAVRATKHRESGAPPSTSSPATMSFSFGFGTAAAGPAAASAGAEPSCAACFLLPSPP